MVGRGEHRQKSCQTKRHDSDQSQRPACAMCAITHRLAHCPSRNRTHASLRGADSGACGSRRWACFLDLAVEEPTQMRQPTRTIADVTPETFQAPCPNCGAKP